MQYQFIAGDGTVDVTLIEGVGGVIEGTFTGVFALGSAGDGGVSLVLSGNFRVCRGPDLIPV
jgi:hypothetical protein